MGGSAPVAILIGLGVEHDWLVVIEDAIGGAIEILELAALERPKECP